jgi:hypothetical protein
MMSGKSYRNFEKFEDAKDVAISFNIFKSRCLFTKAFPTGNSAAPLSLSWAAKIWTSYSSSMSITKFVAICFFVSLVYTLQSRHPGAVILGGSLKMLLIGVVNGHQHGCAHITHVKTGIIHETFNY